MTTKEHAGAIESMLVTAKRKPTRMDKPKGMPASEKERLQGYFPPDLARALRIRAIEERRRVSSVIVEAVRQYLATKAR